MTPMAVVRAPMPGMEVDNKKLGMWVFLLSEVMFFTGLIGEVAALGGVSLQLQPHLCQILPRGRHLSVRARANPARHIQDE